MLGTILVCFAAMILAALGPMALAPCDGVEGNAVLTGGQKPGGAGWPA
jgi:hypothetical protein